MINDKPTLFICTKCGMQKHSVTSKYQANLVSRKLKKDLQEQLKNQNCSIKLTSCMGACDFSIGYAFSAPGKEQLLFGGGGTKTAATDIAKAFADYINQRAGKRFWIKHCPTSMHGQLISRIPPLFKRGS